MASAAAYTLKNPIIPIQTELNYDELYTVKVENSWVEGLLQKSHKCQLPFVGSVANKELLICALDQLFDAFDSTRLNVTNAHVKYSKARIVLGGDVLLEWQRLTRERLAVVGAPTNLTDAHFNEDLNNLLSVYLAPSSFEDQREYLNTTVKPYNMSCDLLCSRLRVVNALTRYLPGSNNTMIAPDELAMKRLYFKMMPGTWKVEFAKSTRSLDDATYTVTDLARFMAVHENLSKSGKRSASAPSYSHGRNVRPRNAGGRGRGRSGGRGFGRGHFGRGQGSYGQGSYNYGGPSSYPPSSYRSPSSYGRGSYSGGRSGSGGRYNSGGRYSYSPRAGASSSGRGRGRGYSLQPRQQGAGRGGLPNFPSFYQGQDQYYHQPQGSGRGGRGNGGHGRGYGRGYQSQNPHASSSYFAEDMFFGGEVEGHEEEEVYHEEQGQEEIFYGDEYPEQYDDTYQEYNEFGF